MTTLKLYIGIQLYLIYHYAVALLNSMQCLPCTSIQYVHVCPRLKGGCKSYPSALYMWMANHRGLQPPYVLMEDVAYVEMLLTNIHNQDLEPV